MDPGWYPLTRGDVERKETIYVNLSRAIYVRKNWASKKAVIGFVDARELQQHTEPNMPYSDYELHVQESVEEVMMLISKEAVLISKMIK